MLNIRTLQHLAKIKHGSLRTVINGDNLIVELTVFDKRLCRSSNTKRTKEEHLFVVIHAL